MNPRIRRGPANCSTVNEQTADSGGYAGGAAQLAVQDELLWEWRAIQLEGERFPGVLGDRNAPHRSGLASHGQALHNQIVKGSMRKRNHAYQH